MKQSVKISLVVVTAFGLTACTAPRVQVESPSLEALPNQIVRIVPPDDRCSGGGESARLAFFAAAKQQGLTPLAKEISIHQSRGWSSQALATLYRLRIEHLAWQDQISDWLGHISGTQSAIRKKSPSKSLRIAFDAWICPPVISDPASELLQSAAKLDARLIPWAKAISTSHDPKTVATLQHFLHQRSGQAIVEALRIAQVAEDEDRVERLTNINAAILRRNRARVLAEEYIRRLENSK